MTVTWADRVDELNEMLDAGYDYGTIAKHFGVSRDTLRGKMHYLRQRGLLQRRERQIPLRELAKPETPIKKTIELEFPDKKKPEINLHDIMQSAIDMQRQLRLSGHSQSEATVDIKTDEPFAVAFTADWHIGSAGVWYERLFQHLQLILDVPNLYFGAVGDMVDNFIKSKIKSAMLHALFGPQMQHDVVKEIFRRIGHKCIFATAGNHDEWTDSEAGIDLAASFYEGICNAPYLRAGGGINLSFNGGEVEYRIYAKHKYSMNSRLNRSHGSKRMHELESPYDVGVLAHTHSPTIEHTERWSGAYGKDTIHIVTGTYKVEDYFGASNGFGASALAVSPTVIFFPHEKRMIPFFHIEDAVMMLRALSSDKPMVKKIS
ncbi:MAG: hypothetical protein K6T83_01080 [Alicyclobacillus sp.]|nr:hypothetical protein [Alicyclobacillus sp.]